MHIYLVNFEFPPIGGPGIWRALAIAKYASQAGHQVTVLCSDRATWHSRTDPELLTTLPKTIRVHRTDSTLLNDITLRIKAREDTSKNPLIQRSMRWLGWHTKNLWPDPIIHWTFKTTLLARRLAKENPPDCIITTGPPHFSHLVGYTLNKGTNIPWIMDYRDPWTDFEKPEQISHGPYQLRLGRRLEKRLLNKASAVTTVSPSWLALLKEKMDNTSKIHLIYNGYDIDTASLTREHSFSETDSKLLTTSVTPIHIHFNGTIQPNNNVIKELLDALDLIQTNDEFKNRFIFTFCGLLNNNKALIDERCYSKTCVDLGPADHSTAINRCLLADVLLVLVGEGDQARQGTIPAKVYEAIALRKPILAILPYENDTRQILEANANHPTISVSTRPIDIVDALVKLSSKFDANRFIHAHLADQIDEQQLSLFHRKKQVEQFLELASQLQKYK